MNLTALRYYVTLYQERSISRAADRLYMTRQALSKSLAKLEKEVGVKLIRSTGRGIEFTAAGDLFYRRVSRLLHDYDAALRELHQLDQENRLNIRLGVDYMTSFIYDEAALQPFLAEHPALQITRTIRTPDELENDYVENQFDIVLSHIRVPASTASVYISHVPLGVLFMADDPLASRRFLKPEDLENREVYATGGNTLFIQECNKYFHAIHSSCVVRPTQTNELFTNLYFIEKNRALFITTGYYRHSLAQRKLYRFVPLKFTDRMSAPNHDVYLYGEPDVFEQKEIRALISYLKDLPTKIRI